MAPIGTLWGDIRQRQTKVILSVAALNGLELNQPTFSFKDRPADYTQKFAYGKIPAYEHANGFKLIEGTTIARYLSSIGTQVDLLAANKPEDAVLVDQWVHYAEHELLGPITAIAGQVYGYFTPFYLTPFNLEVVEKNRERLTRALNYLESHLATQPSGYVTLGRLTLADLVLASTIDTAARLTLGISERQQYPQIFGSYNKVTGDEKIKQYWGTERFVDAPINEPRVYTG